MRGMPFHVQKEHILKVHVAGHEIEELFSNENLYSSFLRPVNRFILKFYSIVEQMIQMVMLTFIFQVRKRLKKL